MASPNPTPAHDTQHFRPGRRQIPIQFIKDRNLRQIRFSKRKAGIMKKAFELSTLTGTEVLLLTVSETNHVYTFTTPKFRPLIKQTKGRELIQAYLKAPDSPHFNDLTLSTFLLSKRASPSSDNAQISASSSAIDRSAAFNISTPPQTERPIAPAIPRAPITPSSDIVSSLSSGLDQPVQVPAARLIRLLAYNQSIDLATVEKKLLQCPSIANFLRAVVLVNGFNLDRCPNVCWQIPSLTDPSSVLLITVTGSIGQIVVASFFSKSQIPPDHMTLQESFRFVRGSHSWLLQEWNGHFLELHQIYFDLQAFISLGIVRLDVHPIYQAEQTRILTERLVYLQEQWIRPISPHPRIHEK